MSRPQVIVFAKAPRAGVVKTRLCPPLDPDQCAWFYAEMLADVLERTLRLVRDRGLEPVCAFDPPDAANELLSRTPAGYRLQVQSGLGLGERMANAFAEAAAAGAPWALLRGSDSPGLTSDHFDDAIERLEDGADVVLTPDQGGGYAMIGLRWPHSNLFDAPMSTDRVLEETLELARRAGLRSEVTAAAFDIDTVADFRHVDAMRPSESSDSCPRTVDAIGLLRDTGVL